MPPDISSPASLAFVLDAPLQSWGTESRFQRRGTGLHPSKSAVLGMIAAALGIDKYDPDATQAEAGLAALDFSCAVLPRMVSGPRGQRPARARQLVDYHTVGGGYDPDNARLSIPRSAERGSFGTVVTRRTYLADARFLVLLQGDSGLLERVQEGLRNPVWGLWLGRKSCPPAMPVHPALAPTRSAAVAAALLPLQSRQEAGSLEWETLERWEERSAPGRHTRLTMDQSAGFAERVHRARSVEHFRPEPPSASTPDAMFDSINPA